MLIIYKIIPETYWCNTEINLFTASQLRFDVQGTVLCELQRLPLYIYTEAKNQYCSAAFPYNKPIFTPEYLNHQLTIHKIMGDAVGIARKMGEETC